MNSNRSDSAWARLQRSLGAGTADTSRDKWQPHGDIQPHIERLEQRLAQQAEALFNANAALAAEIRDRQTSEARYRILVETSPVAILLTRLDGTIDFANPQAAVLFGFDSAEQMVGLARGALIAYTIGETVPTGLASNQPGSSPANAPVVELRRQDGTSFSAEVYSATVYDGEGEPGATIIVLQDISARQRAQQALQQAYRELETLNRSITSGRRLLQALFNGLGDGLLLVDHLGQVQLANRAAADLLAVPTSALEGQPWGVVGAWLAPDALPEAFARLQHGSYPRRRLKAADGSMHLLDVRVITLDDDVGEPGHSIVHLADVTETVRRQEQAMENERFAAAGRLAASVAHEINTPLQTIQTSLELLQAMPAEQHGPLLADAQQELLRVGRIVRQLLDIYRPAAEAPVDMALLLDRVTLLLGKRMRDQQIDLRLDAAAGPHAFGRADELTQVLINLIVNALDAMPTGGTLAIRIHPDADPPLHVVVAVGDTGPGIAEEIKERIFEPFFTTKPEGTGLGLAVSRQIVERHGGVLELASQAHQGSTFSMRLPVCYAVNPRK